MRWGEDGERGWTPADLGVPHESLEALTRDGLRLLAWYLPGADDADADKEQPQYEKRDHVLPP